MKGYRGKALLFGLAVSMVLAGCGSSTASDTAAVEYSSSSVTNGSTGIYTDEAVNEEYYESESGSTSSESVRAGRKLIRTVELDVETLEFEELLSYVQAKTDELGGYVENLNVYNGSSYNYYGYSGTGYRNDRSASLTLRIPKDNLDNFLIRVEESSNIISRSEREQDVTLNYVDLDSHKQVLLAEQERLLALMEQAETIEDLITLESRLSDIRYQIESMESQLRTYDNQIEYSTVYLDITEVIELTPVETVEQTAWERISEGFMHSLRNIGNGIKEFFIGFIIAIPYLIVLAVVALIILGIVLACIKSANKKKNKRLEQERAKQEAYMQQMQQNYAQQQAYTQQVYVQNQQVQQSQQGSQQNVQSENGQQ